MTDTEPFFKIGDVVRMHGYEVNMTVTLAQAENVYTAWFDTTNNLRRDVFKASLLSKRRTS